jgi:hypothetical protein
MTAPQPYNFLQILGTVFSQEEVKDLSGLPAVLTLLESFCDGSPHDQSYYVKCSFGRYRSYLKNMVALMYAHPSIDYSSLFPRCIHLEIHNSSSVLDYHEWLRTTHPESDPATFTCFEFFRLFVWYHCPTGCYDLNPDGRRTKDCLLAHNDCSVCIETHLRLSVFWADKCEACSLDCDPCPFEAEASEIAKCTTVAHVTIPSFELCEAGSEEAER